MTAPISRSAARPEVSVRVRRPGTGPAAPRMLLLHGLADSEAVWDPFVERAPASWEVWTADLPWRSEADPAWAHEPDAGRWITEALLQVDGRTDVVVAHSFAANLWLGVLDAAEVAPPAGTVLVSPFHRDAAERFDWASMAYYLNDFHRILEYGIRVRAGDRFRDDLGEAMALRVRERIGPYGWIRFFEAYLRAPFLRPERMGSPALVVAGKDDFAAFPADARSLVAKLPAARLEILTDCGHFPMVEQADRFAALVTDFCASVRPSPPSPPRRDRDYSGAQA